MLRGREKVSNPQSRANLGFYRYQGGTEACISRSIAYAPYADLLWYHPPFYSPLLPPPPPMSTPLTCRMETKKPIYDQAKQFSTSVKAVYPDQWLAYNLSPSFNWRAAGLTPQQEKAYIWELGKLGFVWQFITLAGLHTTALAVDTFARAFATEGMQAYCEMVQEPEREAGVEVLTHQVRFPIPLRVSQFLWGGRCLGYERVLTCRNGVERSTWMT
jgi:isocitrate lyase